MNTPINPRIRIFDTTLRDGEQSPGCSMTPPQKLVMARALAERGLRPDLALVSGAVRTRETWERLHEDFGDVEVRYEPGLYNASAERLRRSVEAAGDEAGCLLILAHNPGVHLLAVKYLEEAAASPPVLERLSVGFPPAACAVFAVDPAGRPVFESLLTPRAAGVAG